MAISGIGSGMLAQLIGQSSTLKSQVEKLTAQSADGKRGTWYGDIAGDARRAINLRGEMAFPVAKTLRERGVPFVFATGYDQAVVPADFSDVFRWEKPFDADALARMMPNLVRAR